MSLYRLLGLLQNLLAARMEMSINRRKVVCSTSSECFLEFIVLKAIFIVFVYGMPPP